MPKGQRLDLRLIELELFNNRQIAQSAIIDGGILVNGQKQTKPGMLVNNDATIEIAPNWGPPKYVSRGGLKLEKALKEFCISVNERVCLDIGASTGGFTDCLLKHKASCVYAIDVGYGQLDWSLRNDPRVIVCERINARELTPDLLYKDAGKHADLAVIDVSFISLKKILPACSNLLTSPTSEVITLIKPQFEAGRKNVGKGGVVRNPEIHKEVIANIIAAAYDLNFSLVGLTFSPLKGPAGNIEYLASFSKKDNSYNTAHIEVVVNQAHKELTSS